MADNVLTHYTSFDAALHILLTGKVKFGNILNSNDQVEIDLIKDKTEKYLIFCGCTKPMTSLMWFAYAKNKYGVCISFNLKKGERKRNLFMKNDKSAIKAKSINYSDKAKKVEVGFTKDKVFKSESEYRYLHIGNNETFFADINWDIIESITLTVSTFFTASLVESIFKDRIPVDLSVVTEKRFNI